MPDVGASIHRVQPLYPVFRRFFYFFIAVVPFLSVSSWATIISFLLRRYIPPIVCSTSFLPRRHPSEITGVSDRERTPQRIPPGSLIPGAGGIHSDHRRWMQCRAPASAGQTAPEPTGCSSKQTRRSYSPRNLSVRSAADRWTSPSSHLTQCLQASTTLFQYPEVVILPTSTTYSSHTELATEQKAQSWLQNYHKKK